MRGGVPVAKNTGIRRLRGLKAPQLSHHLETPDPQPPPRNQSRLLCSSCPAIMPILHHPKLSPLTHSDFSSSAISLTAFPPPPSPTESEPEHSLPKECSGPQAAAANGDPIMATAPPAAATAAVLVQSVPIPEDWKDRKVKGIDFNDFAGRDVSVSELVKGMARIGFQGSNVSRACEIIDDMVALPSCLSTCCVPKLIT